MEICVSEIPLCVYIVQIVLWIYIFIELNNNFVAQKVLEDRLMIYLQAQALFTENIS